MLHYYVGGIEEYIVTKDKLKKWPEIKKEIRVLDEDF